MLAAGDVSPLDISLMADDASARRAPVQLRLGPGWLRGAC